MTGNAIIALARDADEMKALRAAGATSIWRVWEVDDLAEVFEGNALRAGDILLLASPDAIGPNANAREKRLEAFAERGVLVQVLGGEAILYDAQERRAEFREIAIRAQRAAAARNRRSPGRPRKAKISQEDKQNICAMWWDKNIPRASVLARASEVAGQPVSVHEIKRWCGMARRKPCGGNGINENDKD